MASYVTYLMEDGSELLVELADDEYGSTKAGLGDTVDKLQVSFDKALDSARLSALQIQKKFHDVAADEVEVKFGLKATGEIGNNIFAIGKAGVEANYEVTLKWKKADDKQLGEEIRKLQQQRLRHRTHHSK